MVDVVDVVDLELIVLLDVEVGAVELLPIHTARVAFALRFAYSPVSQSEPTHGFQAVSCAVVILVSEARSEHR